MFQEICDSTASYVLASQRWKINYFFKIGIFVRNGLIEEIELQTNMDLREASVVIKSL